MSVGLKLKPRSRARALAGHPWVFAGEVQKLLPSEYDGQVVECRDSHGHMLGSGLYNSRSQIIWRRFSREKADLDASFLRRRIQEAIARRKVRSVRRLVSSDADQLPGLVMDQYGKTLVLQTLTFGMHCRIDLIADIVDSIVKPERIILRNDSSVLKLEGLPQETRVVRGSQPKPQWLKLGRIEFQIDGMAGQKTGFYIDQQDAYEEVASFARGRRVLDCFCNQGGFALHCAQAGASHVTGVDISSESLIAAQNNAQHNDLNGIDWIEANVFDYLRLPHARPWDLIILDPPPFARGKGSVPSALAGYKEIHVRALRLLTPGGILATYCCSHHVNRTLFEEVVRQAAADARRDLHILCFCHQPPDHPILLHVPETEYLHGLILEAI